jgi:hypothetical protein
MKIPPKRIGNTIMKLAPTLLKGIKVTGKVKKHPNGRLVFVCFSHWKQALAIGLPL